LLTFLLQLLGQHSINSRVCQICFW